MADRRIGRPLDSFPLWNAKQEVRETERHLHQKWINYGEETKKEYLRKIGLDPTMTPAKHRKIVAAGNKHFVRKEEEKQKRAEERAKQLNPRIAVPNNIGVNLGQRAQQIPAIHQQQNVQNANFGINHVSPAAILRNRQLVEAEREKKAKQKAIELMANSIRKNNAPPAVQAPAAEGQREEAKADIVEKLLDNPQWH